jgi:plastocyanin
LRSIVLPVSFVAAAALVSAGCGSDAKNAVNVVSTASTCEVASTNLPAGKTTFKVQNKGGDVTEMYVLQGSRTLGEVENIGPGTSRTLTANLKAGEYELACKPGMKGDGIKTKITVTGSGGESSSAPAREVDVDGRDFSFGGLDGFSARAGEKVEFVLHNTGTQEHELEMLAADGTSPGEVSETKAGETGEAEITFTKAGTYTYRCGLLDHEQRGMKGSFTVSA